MRADYPQILDEWRKTVVSDERSTDRRLLRFKGLDAEKAYEQLTHMYGAERVEKLRV